MLVTHYETPFPSIFIENTYSDSELHLIWEELNFLCHPQKLLPPEKTGGAISGNTKENLKKNNARWLDNLYEDRKISNILTVNRKIFDKFDEIKSSHPSWFFNNFTCNFDTTQISYYEKNDYYGAHTDASILTALTWFYKEPKKFQGGDIFFTDYDLQHSIQNNSTLIFPSCIKHSVSTIEMGDENLNKRLGRFCMAQFFQIKSEH